MTAQRTEQTAQPQSGAAAEHAAQTRSGAPDAELFSAANSAQSGAQHGEISSAAERIQNSTPRGENPPVKGITFLCRAMRPEDVPACAAIEAAVPDGWSAGALAEELTQPTARLFVAEISDGAVPGAQTDETTLHTQPIAALAVFQLVCEEANLYTVSTAPTLRRQGAACALLQYAFAQLAAQGAQTIFLEVRAQNKPARALYTALGFEETGTRRGFYTKPYDDAVLMQKSMDTS